MGAGTVSTIYQDKTGCGGPAEPVLVYVQILINTLFLKNILLTALSGF